MVSTGWRTASTVIIIVVGAALLTFAIFIYRRQKQLREGPIGPEMQQRYKGSFAGDPEAHTPLLMVGGELPPIPPKSAPFAHQRNLSVESFTYQRNGPSVGDLREVGGRVRAPRPRVPVPPMFPEPSVPAIQERRSLHGEPKAAPPFPVPEPASPSKPLLFPFANIQFPRIQIKSDGKKGRLPSLRIEFQRESNQVISSPGSAYRPPPSAKHTPPPSTVSAPSTYSRPFATMASSPLPEIPRISPIAIDRRSPTASAPNSAANSVINIAREDASSPSTSVQDVGHGLFTRKLSTEAGSFQTMSRNSSARPASDPGRLLSTLSTASRSSVSRAESGGGTASGSGSSSSVGAPLRRAGTWVPDVMASYSPWRGVVPLGNVGEGQGKGKGIQAESPTGELRVAEGYRPMPTLEETGEVTPATIPASLPDFASTYDAVPSPSYLPEDESPDSSGLGLAQEATPPGSPSYLSQDPLPLPPHFGEVSSPRGPADERLSIPRRPPLPPSPSSIS